MNLVLEEALTAVSGGSLGYDVGDVHGHNCGRIRWSTRTRKSVRRGPGKRVSTQRLTSCRRNDQTDVNEAVVLAKSTHLEMGHVARVGGSRSTSGVISVWDLRTLEPLRSRCYRTVMVVEYKAANEIVAVLHT